MISITIFLMFVTFVTSIPLLSERHNDPLSGFKECDGYFPDKITLFSFSPDPVVVGQPINIRMAGDIPEPIEEGSTLTVTGFLNNEQAFNDVTDFCQYFVEPNFKCPLKDHFDITTSYPTMTDPSDPKNTTLDFIVQISGKYEL